MDFIQDTVRDAGLTLDNLEFDRAMDEQRAACPRIVERSG